MWLVKIVDIVQEQNQWMKAHIASSIANMDGAQTVLLG